MVVRSIRAPVRKSVVTLDSLIIDDGHETFSPLIIQVTTPSEFTCSWSHSYSSHLTVFSTGRAAKKG